jgi:hypothetical protein
MSGEHVPVSIREFVERQLGFQIKACRLRQDPARYERPRHSPIKSPCITAHFQLQLSWAGWKLPILAQGEIAKLPIGVFHERADFGL